MMGKQTEPSNLGHSSVTMISLSYGQNLSGSTPSPTRIQFKRFTPDSRYVVTEWMYQVCERVYKERTESRLTFHTAVHGLDKVLSKASLRASSPEFSAVLQSEAFLQLTGLCCVVMAMAHLRKRNVISSPSPRAEKMIGFCGSKYSEDQYVRLLGEIVRFEPFEDVTTSVEALQLLCQDTMGSSSVAIANLSLVLADSYILEYPTLKHSSQDVALCSFWVAKKMIEKDPSPPSSDINQTCFQEIFYVAYVLFKEDMKQNQTTPSTVSAPLTQL